jgi:CspA family cold shock protein
MTEGTVKFYNRTKRFGFITGDDGKDYFFHISGVKEEAVLNEGDKVKFDVVEGERGPKAENIEKI